MAEEKKPIDFSDIPIVEKRKLIDFSDIPIVEESNSQK